MKNIKVLGLAIAASLIAAPAFAGETYVRNDWSDTISNTTTNLTLNSTTNSTRNEWYDSYADKVYVEGELVTYSGGDYNADGNYYGVEFGAYEGHEGGTVSGDVNGTVDGDVNGTVDGDVNGSIGGHVGGSIRGAAYPNGYLSGSLNGRISNGSFDGSVENGSFNGSVENGSFNGSVENGQYSGQEQGGYAGFEGGKINLAGHYTETSSVSGGDGFSIHTAGSSLWGDFTETINNTVTGSIITTSGTTSNSHETSSGVR